MATNTELEARLRANPDDNDTWAVYGDWLSEQGDPRGELLAIQRKLAANPSGDLTALTGRATELIARNNWLGELGTLGPKDFSVTWRNGFLDSVQLGTVDDYNASEIDFAETIDKVFALPGIQFLRQVVCGSKAYDDSPCEWDDCVEALAGNEISQLRRLVFDHGGYWDISSTAIGSLASLYPKLPNLRELYISMGQWSAEGIDLPELRSFEVVSSGATKKDLEHIRTGKLPKLEKLSLCLGQTGGDYGGDIELDDLLWIVSAEGLAGVRHLGLANSNHADGIAALLAESPILAQLRTLDLSRGTLGEEGAQVMLDNAKRFAHLESIDISQSYLDEGMREKLKAIGPKIIADHMNGATDPDDRYVAISE